MEKKLLLITAVILLLLGAIHNQVNSYPVIPKPPEQKTVVINVKLPGPALENVIYTAYILDEELIDKSYQSAIDYGTICIHRDFDDNYYDVTKDVFIALETERTHLKAQVITKAETLSFTISSISFPVTSRLVVTGCYQSNVKGAIDLPLLYNEKVELKNDINILSINIDLPLKNNILPIVNKVNDGDTVVTGKSEPGYGIAIKKNSETIGKSITKDDGCFQVTVPSQTAGTVLDILTVDAQGNESKSVKLEVRQTNLEINEVGDNDEFVTGKANPGELLYLKYGDIELGSVHADQEGNFKMRIEPQKAGSCLNIIAYDDEYNKDGEVKAVIIDKTPPFITKISDIYDRDKEITGMAEEGSKISVYSGSKIIGSTISGSTGFKLSILPQKWGTVITISVEDNAGNATKVTKTVIRSVKTLASPRLSAVYNTDKVIKGNAEADLTIVIKKGNKIINSKTIGKNGVFTVNIPIQKEGTLLLVYLKDSEGNVSSPTRVIVQAKNKGK